LNKKSLWNPNDEILGMGGRVLGCDSLLGCYQHLEEHTTFIVKVEDQSRAFLQNPGNHLQDYMTLQPSLKKKSTWTATSQEVSRLKNVTGKNCNN
jgi:hypothetical protein